MSTALLSLAWGELAKHHKSLVDVKIRDLFSTDPTRFSQFSVQMDDILLDFSKQRINHETLYKLCSLADSAHLSDHIQGLFAGKFVNTTEQKPALHTALRDPTNTPIIVNNQDIKHKIHEELSKMEIFVERLRSSQYLGITSKPITQIISLGIGGSDLGPSMVCQALSEYKTNELTLHFVSNVDGKTLAKVLKSVDPQSTLCIVNSKTFTTPETLQNAKTIKTWFSTALGEESLAKHLIGVTSNPQRAIDFGITPKNIFEFWDFVGGRFSVWSAVGLPIALSIGMPNFRAFLAGAHAMDQHFLKNPFAKNLPVLMALIGIWNINFWNSHTLAIIPYDDNLRQLPDYLQQLEMESNGKTNPLKHQMSGYSLSTGKDKTPNATALHAATAPVIWGGVGCNGQHAYMQLLHQGTQIIPIDFLIAARGQSGFEEQHRLLLASCLSQSRALMEGDYLSTSSKTAQDPYKEMKQCLGNRPSNTIIYPKLTPHTLGSLLALYEHKVFVQGILWGINSFDQWGVELGKRLVKEILPILETSASQNADRARSQVSNELETEGNVDLDSSTKGLLDYISNSS